MQNKITLKKLEQQIVRLPIHEQLKLIARISELLSTTQLGRMMSYEEQTTSSQQREKEADIILNICDSAADKWEGDFDSNQDVHQIRLMRDEQIW